MQAKLELSKEECLTILKDCYTKMYRVPVEVTPVFPLIPLSEENPTVFFKMNEAMLGENNFFEFLNGTLEQAGFIIIQSNTYVTTNPVNQFQGVSVIIQIVAEVNLDVLPECLRSRIQNLQFVDRALIYRLKK